MTVEAEAGAHLEPPAPSGGTSPGDWLQLLQVVPRTVRFAHRARRPEPGSPVPPLTWRSWPLVQASLDDLFVSIGRLRGAPATRTLDADAVIEEQLAALDVLSRAGVEADPARMYPEPRPVSEHRLTERRRPRLRFEHLSFPSAFEPPEGMPRADRWHADSANHVAHAYLLRHEGPRPWVVAIHGAGAGEPFDLLWMGSVRAHRRLGVNVLNLVLPRHGPRSRAASDDRFPGPDLLVNLYGFAQAMSDARAAVAWARAQHATAIAVHGISLGSYSAALLAGLEPDLDCVIAGTPLVDVVALVRSHSVGFEEQEQALLQVLEDPSTERINRLVCPLTFPPLTPRSGRVMYAAIADRMAMPEQAVALWEHWEEPETLWLHASHIGAVFARKTRGFVEAALRSRGIATDVR
ncbi:MAG: hypothetical protein U0V73_15480 [Acidimicrobiia bacterium]